MKLSAKKLYETILDAFPPEFYNKEIFNIKTDIVFAHIMEKVMRGRQYAS